MNNTSNTPTKLTAEELTEIREREDKATPLPWSADHDYWNGCEKCLLHQVKANKSFLLNARTDIPALLSHIEAREAELRKIKEQGEFVAKWLESSLNCKQWGWDTDQWGAANSELQGWRKLLSTPSSTDPKGRCSQ